MEPTQLLDFNGFQELAGGELKSYEDIGVFRVYHLEWDNGDWAKIYRNGEWLHWDMLVSQAGEHLYQKLMGQTVKDSFAKQGIKAYSTNRGGADDLLLRTGFEHHRGHLVHHFETQVDEEPASG